MMTESCCGSRNETETQGKFFGIIVCPINVVFDEIFLIVASLEVNLPYCWVYITISSGILSD
jgi:hypothetical protein